MRYQKITSVQNPQAKAWRALREKREREAAGCFLAEGVKMTQEAANHARVRSVLFTEEVPEQYGAMLEALEARGAQLYAVSEAVLKAVCEAKTPQHIAACVEMPVPRDLRGKRIVALDGVQDPGNVGTIIRTADAAGFEGVLLAPGCADVYSAKTLRATMGSIFRMAVAAVEDLPGELAALRGQGYEILSSELSGTPFYARRKSERAVLVIGNESAGVSPQASQEATQRLRLPMRGGAESLNAAVAAGIMMYELARDEAEWS
jgi:TrmH family RNA methyltransferase